MADRRSGPAGLWLLLPYVLVSFAANSLITRYVADGDLLDAGLLTVVRFVSGAVALVLLALGLHERPGFGRGNVVGALWLGVYAVCISYGYQHIGAAAGTFVFYATVLITLVAADLVRRVRVPGHRLAGAGIALVGLAVLASRSIDTVTPLGVLLLAVTGAAWGLYTLAGRSAADPRRQTTGNFVLLALVLLVPGAYLAGPAAEVRITGAGLLWGVVMGTATTAFAYVAWYACQRSISATSAGTVQLAIPVLTAVGAVVLLGERLTPALVVAAALVGGGMWLAARPARPRRPVAAGPPSGPY
jgi:drug/metabolite transporter (DMT)-like permease